MGTKNGLLLLTAFCLYSTAWSEAPKTLRLVNLVYRHGDRSPVKLYPNYPKPVSTTWPQGLGWLTSDGMREQFALGSYLRRRYSGFLDETYINTQISVHSADTDRCLMSAYCNLAGLYPPSGHQEWNKNISWQPIPVHTRPNYEDNDLSEGELCPRYEKLFNATLKSDQVKKEEKENKAFYEFIVKKTGVVHETIRNIWQIADTLYCEQQHNVAWPSWVNNSTFDKLRKLETWGFDLRYQGREERRLTGGPLLKEWIELTQSYLNKTLPTKMNMFSAHDTTVASVMSALGVFNKLRPPYTATFIMELHYNTAFYVELYYRNHTSQDPTYDNMTIPLNLTGCDFQCPFEKFVNLTKDVIPKDWKAECAIGGGGGGGGGGHKLQFNTATIKAVSITCGGVILILVVIITVMCYKQRSLRRGYLEIERQNNVQSL